MLWAALTVAIAVSNPRAPAASARAAARFATPETIAAIQIQGNTATADDEVRRLAGVSVGMRLDATTLDEVAVRLRSTKRFERVEVRKRFASIADPSQIVLVIIVDEGPVRIETSRDPSQPARVVKRRRPNLMFLPVIDGEDGYGLTYGARLAIAGPLGAQSRIAFPATWGGTRQVGAELDKSFASGALHRVFAGGSISRRTNPFYDEDDGRARVWVRAERAITRPLRAGATLGLQRVSFVSTRDTFTHAGADLVLDTRLDPLLPRNAIYARAAWERFDVRGRSSIARTELDARGYLGLIGQNILALRLLRTDASASLPPYLQPLLGGMANLRGFRAGYAAGDTLLATTAELFVPLTSPLDTAKIGVSVFADRGTVYADGQRLADQSLREGYGASVWLTAAVLRVSLAVAQGRGASTRVHAGGTLAF